MATKKYLYATTALIGAGVATSGAQAQGIDVNVGGFTNYYVGLGSNDTADDSNQILHDAELTFSGSVTLDNGVEVGVNLNKEFNGGQDPVYTYFKGSFGTIQLGTQNSAAYSHSYSAGPLWSGPLVPINSGWQSGFADVNNNVSNFYSVGGSTHLDFADEGNRIAYYSPNVGGFQLGASWSPSLAANNFSSGFPTGGAQIDDNSSTLHDGLSLSASFDRDFSNVGVSAYAGLNYAHAGGSAAAAGAEDPIAYMTGVRVNSMGFGAGYALAVQDNPDNLTQGSVTSASGVSHGFDVTYSTGPIQVQGEAMLSRVDADAGSAGQSVDQNTFKVGGSYTLGPGVSLGSAVIYNEEESSGAGSGLDAWSAVLGTTVSF